MKVIFKYLYQGTKEALYFNERLIKKDTFKSLDVEDPFYADLCKAYNALIAQAEKLPDWSKFMEDNMWKWEADERLYNTIIAGIKFKATSSVSMQIDPFFRWVDGKMVLPPADMLYGHVDGYIWEADI